MTVLRTVATTMRVAWLDPRNVESFRQSGNRVNILKPVANRGYLRATDHDSGKIKTIENDPRSASATKTKYKEWPLERSRSPRSV